MQNTVYAYDFLNRNVYRARLKKQTEEDDLMLTGRLFDILVAAMENARDQTLLSTQAQLSRPQLPNIEVDEPQQSLWVGSFSSSYVVRRKTVPGLVD
jgi:hypothetical protein